MSSESTRAAVEDLVTLSGSEVLRPGDDEYERLRPDYAIAGEPALIVRPATAEGVAEAVRFAERQNLPLSVRSGGHGPRC